MRKKQKAEAAPSTPGPIRIGSDTHRLMELVATAVAAKLAAGGKTTGMSGGHRRTKRPPRAGGTDGQ